MLLKGLEGDANINGDKFIDVKELERYLEDEVPIRAFPRSQTPFVRTSDKKKKLSVIVNTDSKRNKGKNDTSSPKSKKSEKTNTEEISPIESPETSDSTIYHLFKNAIKENHLLSPKNKNAYFYLNKLQSEESFIDAIPGLERELSIALLNNAQERLNWLLANDIYDVDHKGLSNSIDQISIALSLLPETHLLYDQWCSHSYLFEGINDLIKVRSKEKKQQYQDAINNFNLATEKDSMALFARLLKGHAFTELKNWNKAEENIALVIKQNSRFSKAYYYRAELYFDWYQEQNTPEKIKIAHDAIEYCLYLRNDFPNTTGLKAKIEQEFQKSNNSPKRFDRGYRGGSFCASSFDDDVQTYVFKRNGSNKGNSIWISRKSGRAKAKYFAHKSGGDDVHDRYTKWRINGSKNIILKSSGAYATGWNNSNIPVGVTVDNGVIVNRNYHNSMDGLVIVYATGGIAISNIEDGDLYLEALGRKVDIRNASDRNAFLSWAQAEQATVFQMHLLAYNNKIEVGKYNSSPSRAVRKFLVLAKSRDGELFHIIFHLKNQSYSLYNATELVFNYLRKDKRMNVIAIINLDTGGFDILNTAGGATDCNNSNVWGTSNNYEDMTNLLTYEYD